MLQELQPLSDYLSDVPGWFSDNYIEVLATVTGLIYILYSVKGRIWLWLFGLISSVLYVYVWFEAHLRGLMFLYVYYVLVSIYGWYHWKFDKKKEEKILSYTRLKRRTGIYLLGVSVAIFGILIFILDRLPDSDTIFWDAMITAFSITATWMLARKIVEHWLVWIVLDLVSVGLYIYKELFPTVILFGTYTVLAFIGYRTWSKEWKKQERRLYQ